ncbi:hypothetical protein ABZR86_15485 [Dyella marensis]|uniref:Pertussis toxin, subunit 1 n=1 Tax=Dyella marensis TaxID=500610 RepID=A0A1I2GNA5_9GAMM|nr:MULTISPECIES: hypothetical protein [Dyella]SFF18489.1 hypothetical protein SAMN02799615_02699 [Dyella marensis]
MKDSSGTAPFAKRQLRPALLLIMLAWMVSPASRAQVQHLYFYSASPPERVFNGPISGRGTHLNLLRFVLTPTTPSAFVSATASYGLALRVAEARLRDGHDAAGYIYRITANPRFYDVTLSLERFLESESASGGVTAQRRPLARLIQAAIRFYGDNREFVSEDRILPSMVSWAMPVVGINEPDGRFRVQEGARRDNPRWDGTRNSQANINRYPNIHWPAGGLSEELLAVAAPGGWLHPALVPDCEPPQREKRDTGDVSCSGPQPLINLSRLLGVLAIMSSEQDSWDRSASSRRTSDEL